MRGVRSTAVFLVVVGLSVAMLASACSALVSFDGYVGTDSQTDGATDAQPDVALDAATADAPTSGTDASEGGIDAGDAGCPAGRGPTMVTVAAGGVSFCIDSTEVTNAQYAQFLGANDIPSQPSYCTWNTSFVPTDFPGTGTAGQLPVTNLNWCDAYMFCLWAGKRLCGKIGGGPASTSSGADPGTNQHFFACSANGTREFPYGSTYNANACNGPDRDGGGALVDVGTLTTCEGGFSGLFDMSYNAGEWEDACDGTSGANDQCLLVEGTFAFPSGGGSTGGACEFTGTLSRSQVYNDNGFRCCGP